MICGNPDCPDLAATGEHGEYRAGVTHCPYCGERLLERPSSDGGAAETGVAPSGEPEEVFVTSDPAELEIVKSILIGADIPFLVRGQEQYDTFRGATAAHRFNPHAGRLVFLVPADRAEEARALLTEAEPEE